MEQENINKESAPDDIKDLRLRAIMEENPDLKKLYREKYQQIKEGTLIFYH